MGVWSSASGSGMLPVKVTSKPSHKSRWLRPFYQLPDVSSAHASGRSGNQCHAFWGYPVGIIALRLGKHPVWPALSWAESTFSSRDKVLTEKFSGAMIFYWLSVQRRSKNEHSSPANGQLEAHKCNISLNHVTLHRAVSVDEPWVEGISAFSCSKGMSYVWIVISATYGPIRAHV